MRGEAEISAACSATGFGVSMLMSGDEARPAAERTSRGTGAVGVHDVDNSTAADSSISL